MRGFLFLFLTTFLFAAEYVPYPIGYSIPECKIVKQIPNKKIDFAIYLPNQSHIYANEEDYYKGYQDAFFAVTHKKGGWDCLRHYEILANGCIPYFVDLELCPDSNTLYFLPKKLILEAMHLEGVSFMSIDRNKFNVQRYYEILAELMEYTRTHLAAEKMAEYLLKTMNYTGHGKILFLSQDVRPEYLRDLTLIGLKGILGDRVVDTPKIHHLYQTYPEDVRNLWGKGMTYSKILPDLNINISNIPERIARREFDLIIYGETHKGDFPFHDLVRKYYRDDEIAYLYGDECVPACNFNLKNVFMREHYLFHSAILCPK